MAKALRTYSDVIKDVTSEYIASLDKSALPDFNTMRSSLYQKTIDEIELENATRPLKEQKLSTPKDLHVKQITQLIMLRYTFRRVYYSDDDDPSGDLFCVYSPTEETEGIYTADTSEIERVLTNTLFTSDVRAEQTALSFIRANAPRVKPCTDKDLIAVNNGIFDFKTKTLLPFSPDYVFTSKSAVDYDPSAQNIVIHNPDDGTDWDVESWFQSLSDDPEIVHLLWELLGAILRPNVSWDCSAWLYSEQGNNGKGTLCTLMRNLLGENHCASISIANFSKDFMLEALVHSNAIIVDENAVGQYIDNSENLKAVVTHDVILLNRKYKKPVSFRFSGFMVQCLNEFPKVRDRSSSWYRRQLFIPMTKCFTGHTRTYIKQDYLYQREVLEYVLNKVLHMDFYKLSNPAACQEVLEEYKEFNDSVRQFANEILPVCKWDLLPFTFLWDLYREWFSRNVPSGKITGRNSFINDLVNLLPEISGWTCESKQTQYKVANRMDSPEPLIAQYNLATWKSTTYRGNDPKMIGTPDRGSLATSYRGLLRVDDTPPDDDKPTTPDDAASFLNSLPD